MGLGFRQSYTLYKGIEKEEHHNIENFDQMKLILSEFLVENAKKEKVLEKTADFSEEIIDDEKFELTLADVSKEIFLGKIEEYTKGNKKAIREYEYLMFVIKNIHKLSAEIVDWNKVKQIVEPFNINDLGPNAILEKQKIDEYEPTIIEKTFKSKLEKKHEIFKSKMMDAMKKDEDIHNSWRSLIDLADLILKGHINSYFKAIMLISPFEDLLDLGIDFEFGTDDAKIMHVEYVIDSSKIIPYYSLSAKMGALNKVNFDREEHNLLIRDYIASCAIRIARDLFGIIPIDKAIIHIVDHKFNIQTRQSEKITALSLNMDKTILENINIESNSPMEIIKSFEYNMNFDAYDGFSSVSRVSLAAL